MGSHLSVAIGYIRTCSTLSHMEADLELSSRCTIQACMLSPIFRKLIPQIWCILSKQVNAEGGSEGEK